MRLVIVALLLTLGLSACESSDEKPESASPDKPTVSASATTDLKSACDQLGEAIPHDAGGTLDRARMRDFLDEAATVHNAGDDDVRTAVRPLIEATTEIVNSNDPEGLLAAHKDLLDSLNVFNPLCKAAGSNAWS